MSVRPVRLNELLATHAEMRRLNVCLRGLLKAGNETEEELKPLVDRVLRVFMEFDVRFEESTGSVVSRSHD